MKNKIEFCVPPLFEKHKLDYSLLREKMGKNFRYASKGRWAIYHILQSLKIKRGLLLPAYFCETIFSVLNMIEVPYQFYDLNLADLNPNSNSIERKLALTGYDAVLVPSFYGNAADLPQISAICEKYGAKMIDDAAQSFGAVGSDGKMVGTYGAGGLLAFSPGKSTMAHMGSLWWTNNSEYTYKSTNHSCYHYMSYLDFYFNRQLVYMTRYIPIFWVLGFYHKFLQEDDIKSDIMANFENRILGGCIMELLNGGFAFYDYYWNYFNDNLIVNDDFDIIKNISGQKSVPRKIVLLFKSEKKCREMKKYLMERRIGFFAGYNLLHGEHTDIPNTMKIVNHIIELPIENNHIRMEYMLSAINQIILQEK